MTKPTISNHKIIVLVVFVAASIITSLFLFHLKDAPHQTLASSENRLLFPAARDIKPFKLVTANEQPFTQQNFLGHWTLLFFGFTHCDNVCPATLGLISRTYEQLLTSHPNLQVVFISVDPERDTLPAIKKYTNAFHPAFIGVTGKMAEIRKLQSQLGIFASRNQGASADNYQIQHTSSILLINPEGKWAGLFKFGQRPKEFTKSFKASIKALS